MNSLSVKLALIAMGFLTISLASASVPTTKGAFKAKSPVKFDCKEYEDKLSYPAELTEPTVQTQTQLRLTFIQDDSFVPVKAMQSSVKNGLVYSGKNAAPLRLYVSEVETETSAENRNFYVVPEIQYVGSSPIEKTAGEYMSDAAQIKFQTVSMINLAKLEACRQRGPDYPILRGKWHDVVLKSFKVIDTMTPALLNFMPTHDGTKTLFTANFVLPRLDRNGVMLNQYIAETAISVRDANNRVFRMRIEKDMKQVPVVFDYNG